MTEPTVDVLVLLPQEAEQIARHLFELAMRRKGSTMDHETIWDTWSELLVECGLTVSCLPLSRLASREENNRADDLAAMADMLAGDIEAAMTQLKTTRGELQLAVEEIRAARATGSEGSIELRDRQSAPLAQFSALREELGPDDWDQFDAQKMAARHAEQGSAGKSWTRIGDALNGLLR